MIGITMVDPAGVGPEITLKAVAEMTPKKRDATRIFGCRATLDAVQEAVGTAPLTPDRAAAVRREREPR